METSDLCPECGAVAQGWKEGEDFLCYDCERQRGEDRPHGPSSIATADYSAPLEGLLQAWQRLEPDVCHHSPHDRFWVFQDDVIDDAKLHSFAGLAKLMRAVQMAIEARDLNWQTSKNGLSPRGEWQRHATVWHVSKPGQEAWTTSIRSNAEALLAAYLEARGAL